MDLIARREACCGLPDACALWVAERAFPDFDSPTLDDESPLDQMAPVLRVRVRDENRHPHALQLENDLGEARDFASKAERTRRDHDEHLANLDAIWGTMPLDVLEDRSARKGIREERDRLAERSERRAARR